MVWLRDGSTRIRIEPRDILWVSSAGNYVEYSLADGINHLVRGTLAAEEARIKAAAEEDARKIVESAEQEIAAAAKAARRDLTTYAADLAASIAASSVPNGPTGSPSRRGRR